MRYGSGFPAPIGLVAQPGAPMKGEGYVADRSHGMTATKQEREKKQNEDAWWI